MIEAAGDGFRQHFRALLYYSNYLKEIINNFLHGNFVIPQWDFVIGEGSDVLVSLHYYCVGDIFTFFSFLVPEQYMYLYYDVATLSRIYCSGLAFIALCLYKEKKNIFIITSGALLYAFCPLSLENLGAHVFFISTMVYFPLIILGVEKAINQEKPYLLMIAVMLSSLSNIYFFYMNVLSTVIYTIIRMLYSNKEIKERVITIIQVGLYSFVGVLMSAIVFLPMLGSMLSNSRLETKVATDLFYTLEEYKQFFIDLSLGTHSYFGGYSPLGITAIICLFTKKDKAVLKILVGIGLIFACMPFFGKLYNAMVYPTNRWMYALSLLIAYVAVDVFDEETGKEKGFLIASVISVLYYLACVFMDQERWQIQALSMFMVIALFVVIKYLNFKNLKGLLCFSIAGFCVLFGIVFLYSPMYFYRSEGGMVISEIKNIANDEHSIFNEITDDSFFRYSGNRLKVNESIQGDHSSTQYYWSVVNDSVVDFRKQLGLADNSNHHYHSYDERFVLNALASVRYYVRKEKRLLPYGFDYLGNINNYEVYKNNYDLPLVYVYDSYLTEEEWNKYNVPSKNEILVQTAVVLEELSGLSKADLKFENTTINSAIKDQDNLTVENNKVSVNGVGTFKLNCNSDLVGEYYFLIEGLDSYSNVFIGVSYGDINKSFELKGRNSLHYTDRHDYMINLGYMEKLEGDITVEFNGYGEYDYSNISIICQPLDKQIEYLNKLNDLEISKLDFDANTVNAEVSVNKNSLLCFSIPYSKGWKAYIDGKETPLYNCNVQYLGVYVDKGVHTVELRYSRPLGTIGTVLSISGLAIFVYLYLKNRKSKTD